MPSQEFYFRMAMAGMALSMTSIFVAMISNYWYIPLSIGTTILSLAIIGSNIYARDSNNYIGSTYNSNSNSTSNNYVHFLVDDLYYSSDDDSVN